MGQLSLFIATGAKAHKRIFAQGFTQSPSPTARGQARPSTFLHLPNAVTMFFSSYICRVKVS
jgi:hypothetical protein